MGVESHRNRNGELGRINMLSALEWSPIGPVDASKCYAVLTTKISKEAPWQSAHVVCAADR